MRIRASHYHSRKGRALSRGVGRRTAPQEEGRSPTTAEREESQWITKKGGSYEAKGESWGCVTLVYRRGKLSHRDTRREGYGDRASQKGREVTPHWLTGRGKRHYTESQGD